MTEKATTLLARLGRLSPKKQKADKDYEKVVIVCAVLQVRYLIGFRIFS